MVLDDINLHMCMTCQVSCSFPVRALDDSNLHMYSLLNTLQLAIMVPDDSNFHMYGLLGILQIAVMDLDDLNLQMYGVFFFILQLAVLVLGQLFWDYHY